MLTDLSHKRKTVSDLIRFIGNTTEYLESPERVNTPNYSILLGAGASVTSGIRSGQTLINEWKKEIYEESDKKDDISLENFLTRIMLLIGMKKIMPILHCLKIGMIYSDIVGCL